jgi:hypothetical protein
MAFKGIDWRRPWLAGLSALGEPLAACDDWMLKASELASERGLVNDRDQPLSFVAQQNLPSDTPYEAHIAATAMVPTRDNLHDFFNTLIWLHFPKTKRALNTLHARAMPLSAVQGQRGKQRDAATLFDENAALFVSDDASLLDALRERQWASVLMKHASEFFRHADIMLFGHALMEKLVEPYKSITAHVWTVQVTPDWFALPATRRLTELDTRVAAMVQHGFSSADFCHLPVLGVPGWWPGQDAAFYADAEVFRPPRQGRITQAS